MKQRISGNYEQFLPDDKKSRWASIEEIQRSTSFINGCDKQYAAAGMPILSDVVHIALSKVFKINQDNVDYSPVILMYCKLVESLLKAKQTHLYKKAIPEQTTKKGGLCFENLPGKDDKSCEKSAKKEGLTIGSYRYPLLNFTNDYPSHITPNIDILRNFNKADKDDPNSNYVKIEKEVKYHAYLLHLISIMRNKSAHSIIRFNDEALNILTQVLFNPAENWTNELKNGSWINWINTISKNGYDMGEMYEAIIDPRSNVHQDIASSTMNEVSRIIYMKRWYEFPRNDMIPQ